MDGYSLSMQHRSQNHRTMRTISSSFLALRYPPGQSQGICPQNLPGRAATFMTAWASSGSCDFLMRPTKKWPWSFARLVHLLGLQPMRVSHLYLLHPFTRVPCVFDTPPRTFLYLSLSLPHLAAHHCTSRWFSRNLSGFSGFKQ